MSERGRYWKEMRELRGTKKRRKSDREREREKGKKETLAWNKM